ncbi:DUF3600 domain-containing protein [Paenibacillus koleovorans]|uniref:DUF3600 domain-containing protein n=1 Tax=Paenibacillus koleovorans TaxID=121608 RepID=UPI0013E391E2|nr:DUF3600 domain-containing protein [Paenibacillus koleovorans]
MRRNAAVLLLGTIIALVSAAFASPEFADRIYGSFEHVQKKFKTVTIQQYQQVAFKFMGAKRQLGDDYPAFEKLAKQLVAIKIEYANEQQQIDYDALPPEKRAEAKRVISRIQPLFDRLNDDVISSEVFTPEEYDAYIESLLVYETMVARAGVDPSKGPYGIEAIPEAFREEYKAAKERWMAFETRMQQLNREKDIREYQQKKMQSR